MPVQLESIIKDIISSTHLRGKVRDDLEKEMLVHFLEEEKEFQLQGYSEEKIMQTIKTRFGDPEKIGKELNEVHRRFSVRTAFVALAISWILASYLSFIPAVFRNCISHVNATGECGSTITYFLFSPVLRIIILPVSEFFDSRLVSVFFLTLLGSYGVVCAATYFIPRLKKIFSSRYALHATLVSIFSLAMVGLWTSVRLSSHCIADCERVNNNPEIQYGFPLPAIVHDGFGLRPSSSAINLIINFLFWLGMALLAYLCIPKRWKMHAYFPVICFIIGFLSMFYMGVFEIIW